MSRQLHQLVPARQRDVQDAMTGIERQTVRAARQVVAAHELEPRRAAEDEQRVAARVGDVAPRARETGGVRRADAGGCGGAVDLDRTGAGVEARCVRFGARAPRRC